MPTLNEALKLLIEVSESTGPGSTEDRLAAALKAVDAMVERLPRELIDQLMAQ